MSKPRERDLPETCDTCGAELEWETCWNCGGEGGFHDCGEDCCACLDKGEITVRCRECKGKGGYLVCPSIESHG
jgi:hypothetical protein